MNVQRVLDTPAKRYLFVGGVVYAFELLIILLAQSIGLKPTWAVAISFCLGTVASFILQKFMTFGDKRMHHKILIPQIIATSVLIIWNLSFSVAFTALLENRLPAVVTRTLALLITTIWNFYIYKTHIFRNKSEPVY